jgi:hypothetical protein
MKRLLFTAFILTTFIACNSDKKSGDITITGKDGEQVTVNTNAIVNAANEMKNRNEELQKLTPLSIEELKALLPEEIMGAKRERVEATKMAGLATAKAEYKMNDSTNLELTFFDCAGAAGAVYYNGAFFGLMNFEQDNETEYTKTTEFKGGKAIEHCQKNRSECEFTYFGGERFLVQLKGDNLGIDQIKSVAGGLNIK